jgi:hypothetical protein
MIPMPTCGAVAVTVMHENDAVGDVSKTTQQRVVGASHTQNDERESPTHGIDDELDVVNHVFEW